MYGNDPFSSHSSIQIAEYMMPFAIAHGKDSLMHVTDGQVRSMQVIQGDGHYVDRKTFVSVHYAYVKF